MSAIDRLAAKLGVELEFRDASGVLRRPSDDAKRRLLQAMGYAAQSDADAAATLEEIEQAEWNRELQPVVARRSRGALEVPITLPGATTMVRWSVVEEGGARHEGEARFARLALEAQRGDRERRVLVLDVALPLGYHRLRLDEYGIDTALIVAPDRCYVPTRIERGPPLWGIALQLYLLRSERDWGIGDFTDLQSAVQMAAELGASVVGVNPLHATFVDEPSHASPYSPASRIFLNILYIDVTAIAEFAHADEVRRSVQAAAFSERIEAARAAPLVDYDAVTKLKLEALEPLFDYFEEKAEPRRREAFAAFRRSEGDALQTLCLFLALRTHWKEQGLHPEEGERWPRAFRHPGTTQARRFAAEHARRVDFLAWTQWIADEQLAAAAETARREGLEIGLYRDLAVGVDSAGAEAWSDPELYVAGVQVGAPADPFNPAGQNWGLPPMNPHALRRGEYKGIIELLRANMRHAGGLRIDHAMALQHLYWIPQGSPPREGAYITYPFEDLVGILALESERHRCMIVGEDLGTVPEGFRERMSEAGVLSYRILFFEQGPDGKLIRPRAYPHLALATVGSHDLAPLRGWWEGRDIELRDEKRLYPDAGEAARQREARAGERRALVEALRSCRIRLPRGFGADSPFDAALSAAVHRFVARTAAGLAMVQIDELADERDLVNLPGSTSEYPNWRRKQSSTLEQLRASSDVEKLARILRDRRPRPLG